MDTNLLKVVLNSGLEGACIILVLVIAYKIKRARVDVESDCGWCKSSSHNQGATNTQGDENV
jgi:hypothetical protein